MTLEKAKYIISDSKLPIKYVKKEGQIFLNTWHETPFRLRGKDNVSEEHIIGNFQYPLLCADYLLFPSDYMKETLTSAFMIEKIFPGKALMEGYPRNSVFFDENRRMELKSRLNLEGHEIFVYMPENGDVNDDLIYIDNALKDDQLLFVKLHKHDESSIDFSKFNHVQSFPKGFEHYDIANLADILITDHSSVFFDFANTRRKIILFNREDISSDEFYFPLSDLPFARVDNVDDLISQLNSPKDYDDSEFIDMFCQYERINSAEYICKHVFKGEKCCREDKIKNDKENILIYVGSFLNNGITSSFMNLISKLDTDKYNFFLSFRQWSKNIMENHEKIFKNLPENVELLPLNARVTPTLTERVKQENFFTSDNYHPMDKSLNRLYYRTFNKQYFPLDFKIIINYDGYDKNEALMFTRNGSKNAIWVHNDMLQEIKTRQNQNRNILRESYSSADNVCVVSKDLIKPTSEISGRTDNICIIRNICNYESIIENSKKEIKFEETTKFYSANDDINDILSKSEPKFITIGRFSPEKGHERLINAFNQFCRDYPEAHLIIIGGHGDLFDYTVDLVKNSEFADNITLINGISNPMPILKHCDLFILSSFYEGWGIVMMEADILGVPVISTDVVGTQWLKDYGGNLVENSQDGILDGMYSFMENSYDTLDIDYEEFNNEIINVFYSLIDE